MQIKLNNTIGQSYSKLWRISSGMLISLSLFGCALTAENKTVDNEFAVPPSFLKQEQRLREQQEIPKTQQEQRSFSQATISSMAQLQRGSPLLTEVPRFASNAPIKVAAEQLPVPQLAHYVFGELLGLSYVVASDVESMRERVALNLQEEVTPSSLFDISRQLFASNNVEVYTKDNIVYINRATDRNREKAIGIGRESSDMPEFGDTILQLVPFIYNSSNSILNVVNKLSNVTVLPDNNNKLLLLEGSRADVERAMQIVRMMDVPHARGRDIRLLSLVYMAPQQLITQLQELMLAEDISTNTDVSFVAIPRLNSVAVYATSQVIGDRISMWASRLDVPTGGDQGRFYVYRPQFAKAKDLAESINPMLGALAQNANSSNTPASNDQRQIVINADETQNALIIQASQSRYHEVLTLLQQLDRMPGQVAMQVIVAEVDLSSNMQSGIEWFYDSASTAANRVTGSLVPASGQLALGAFQGDWRVNLNFIETRTNVKVLSRPYIIVRDGESATINSGRQVPVLVESVSSDVNLGVTRNTIQYRNTGINLSVTPTINAEGLVSLEISQETSNAESAGQGELALAPVITSRSINTSVLALNGQTVVLGGLIQDNLSENDNNVPFLGRLPILGKLFQSKGNEKKRSELIVMITPRIIQESSEMDDFGRKLAELLSFPVEQSN
ncbi:secretin N-terminal domain-containing protein [Alishewanella longhuensis]